jgi:hypothetical protein
MRDALGGGDRRVRAVGGTVVHARRQLVIEGHVPEFPQGVEFAEPCGSATGACGRGRAFRVRLHGAGSAARAYLESCKRPERSLALDEVALASASFRRSAAGI